MASDMKVGLTLEAEDRASAVLRRASSDAVRQAERTASRSSRIAAEAQRTQERATVRQRTAEERSARAREQLGIRSERAIRREIQLTEAAYNRLARSGRMSSTEQTRAYAQMQQRVAGLRQEMVGLERQQRRGLGSGMMRVGAGVFQAGAAGMAAGMTLARPIGKTMSYESRLAMMANTAYSDRDAQGRIDGMRDLDVAIKDAVSQGGGTREAAAETLDSLLASGALSHSSAVNLLPALQKTSTATGASGTELADVVIRGMQTFGIKESEIPQMLDMAVKAGQGGGFELKDMARWLPKMMAMGRTSGMSGLSDFGALVAAAQASMITGGSTDAAGNNLANLLAKVNSRDTARQAAKIEIAPGKSIDLSGTLSKAAGEGKNSLDAFVDIVDQVVAGNKEYQELQKKIAALDPATDRGERVALMEKQSDILQGSAVGQLIQDQQALLALVGYMGNRDYVKDIKKDFDNGVDAVDVGFQVMAATDEFKVQQGANAWNAAEFEVFKPLAGALGELASTAAELAAEYPELAKATVAVTAALTTLAAVAGSAALLNMMRGRGGVQIPGGTGPGTSPGPGSGGSALMQKIKGVGVAGPLVLGMGAYGAYQVASDDTLTSDQKTDQFIDVGARTAGTWAGMKTGATVGSYAGPWGSIVGGLVGGVAGDWLGDTLAQYIQHLRQTAPTAAESQAAMGAAPNMATMGQTAEQMRQAIIDGQREANKEPRTVDVNVTVDVRNGNIIAEVDRVQAREARRH